MRRERQIGMVNLEDDHHVRILCSDGLDTAYALELVDEIIAIKRMELAKRAATPEEPKP